MKPPMAPFLLTRALGGVSQLCAHWACRETKQDQSQGWGEVKKGNKPKGIGSLCSHPHPMSS